MPHAMIHFTLASRWAQILFLLCLSLLSFCWLSYLLNRTKLKCKDKYEFVFNAFLLEIDVLLLCELFLALRILDFFLSSHHVNEFVFAFDLASVITTLALIIYKFNKKCNKKNSSDFAQFKQNKVLLVLFTQSKNKNAKLFDVLMCSN